MLTVGELEKGIARSANATRKAKLTAWMPHDPAERIRNRLLPANKVDLPVAGAPVG